ncbi:alanine racemase [Vagococcus hydrophili]|uniref:alanine racemase n=1 Tax=Vagococcus hydrophili TaxID=2714947 RepID=UPI003B82D438
MSSPVELFAVVKADSYGHGVVEVAKTALLVGASGLCVSNLNEALFNSVQSGAD